jgi:hypothetical protein
VGVDLEVAVGQRNFPGVEIKRTKVFVWLTFAALVEVERRLAETLRSCRA